MQKIKLLIGFCLLTTVAFAQKETHQKEFSRFALKAGFGSQVVGFPFENITTSSHPAIMIGGEYKLNKSIKHTLSIASTSFFFENKTIGHTFVTSLDFIYRYTHKSGFFSDISVAIGTIYQVHPRSVYELNQNTMEYAKISDDGKFSSHIGFGVGFGYDFNIKFNKPIKVFVKNNFILQTPYFDSKQFPIMPQNIVNVGISYCLPKINFKKIIKKEI